MRHIFSNIQFFLLSLFVFLIPLQTAYLFRQGAIGEEGMAKEGIWQFGTLAVYATDILFLLILVFVCLRMLLLMRSQDGRHIFSSEILSYIKRPAIIFLICFFCIALV